MTTATATAPPVTTMATANRVLLFVPNLIGYARVLMTLSSFVIMSSFPSNWLTGIALYLGSFAGDLLDGMAARKLHQTSSFGGVLDMITDRCGTTGLLFVLSHEYAATDAAAEHQTAVPVWRLTFLALLLLDISSHWCQMYSSLAVGAHHKSEEGTAGKHFLVRWFYKYYWFFGYLCVGAEFTYILLYVRQHTEADSVVSAILDIVLAVCLPGCLAKQAVNVMQLTSACRSIAQYDADQRNQGKTE